MRKFITHKATAAILAAFTLALVLFSVQIYARPISYGMSYEIVTEYEGEVFEGKLKYYPDGTVVNINTNYEEEMTFYYYYKDGYVFSLVAENEEEYEKEVAAIDENFEMAVRSPFYAAKINVFRQVNEGVDGYTTVYTCHSAITLAVIFGALEVVFLGLSILSFVLRRKGRKTQ